MTEKIVVIPLDQLKLFIIETINEAIKQFPPQAQPIPGEFELLTRQEAAKLLSISLPTLHDWTKCGLIKGYRIGSRVRYKKEDVYNSLVSIGTLKFKRGI